MGMFEHFLSRLAGPRSAIGRVGWLVVLGLTAL